MAELSPEQDSALHIAHKLADLGVPIFSAPARTDTPGEFFYPSAWQNFRAEFSHDQIDKWRPGWCLAMVCGVVFDVADVDPRNGGDLADLGQLPAVYGRVATPSAGEHLYIARTHLAKCKPSRGIDLQSGADVPDATGSYGRGFVFLPPTERPAKFGPNQGKSVAYRWELEPVRPGTHIDDGLAHLVALATEARSPRVATIARPQAVDNPVDDDDPFAGAATTWTAEEGARLVARQVLAVEKATQGEINPTLGGAARVLGRLVAGGYLARDDAEATLVAALQRGGVHDDGWNVAHGLKWTAGSVISAGLDRGALEPWTVADPVPVSLPGEPATDDTLPPPGDPLKVARKLLERIDQTDGELHRSWWRGDFYGWTGAHWATKELPTVERWLYQQTGDAVYLVPGKDGDFERRAWAPTKKKIGDLVHALGIGTLQRDGEADQVLACANGVVDVRSRVLAPHRPARFNLWSLPFGYDPDATAPAWSAFLNQILPEDRQAQDFLGEWFGYVLSGRTDQQKMAALIGKRRSGKGTVARVLGAMMGAGNVAGLDLNLLPGTFGMEGLVGKALAVSGDVRWQSRNIADAVPILLGVIGEDAVSVHRKNRSAWEGKLGVRFMLMSNETPTFSDRSQALGGRMVFVKLDQSFYGREDVSLTDKLMSELPGILNWALDGLARLDGRGRFTEPESGHAERDAVRRLSDPIGAFLEDWCDLGPERSISLDHLFVKYQNWCLSEGRTRDSTTKEIFSRDLRTKVPDLTVDRIRVAGKRVRMLSGISSDAL